jgi:hypothetical protein
MGIIKYFSPWMKLSVEWKEAETPKGDPGPIYGFRRGYKVRDAGRHETAEQFSCFQQYLKMGGSRSFAELSRLTGHGVPALTKWSKKFEWEKRTASWQKDQMAISWRQAEKLDRNAHREAIAEFRLTSERQARMMSRVSEDLVRVLGRRISQAEENEEPIPMHMVSGLLRAAASLSEQSRESWGNALGVSELLEVVDAEVEKVRVEELDLDDPYEFEIDE